MGAIIIAVCCDATESIIVRRTGCFKKLDTAASLLLKAAAKYYKVAGAKDGSKSCKTRAHNLLENEVRSRHVWRVFYYIKECKK